MTNKRERVNNRFNMICNDRFYRKHQQETWKILDKEVDGLELAYLS